MTDCILLCGFAPFGGDLRNPSIELVRAIEGETIAGLPIVAVELPCEFERAPAVLDQAIGRCRPRLVLAIGLAAGRSELSFERVAINLIDARIADNAGARPIDEPVLRGGPAAYFATLPIKRMVAAVRAAGIAAAVSHSAGTFVCNQIFYLLQHRLAGVTPSGFLHLPLLPEQAAQQATADAVAPPSQTLQAMLSGLRVALRAALDDSPDDAAAVAQTSEGSLH